jgi:hypothetical protein
VSETNARENAGIDEDRVKKIMDSLDGIPVRSPRERLSPG